jgi:hypothetical protein
MCAEVWPIRVVRIARQGISGSYRLSIFFIGFLAPLVAWGMPPVLEPTVTLTSPDPIFVDTDAVAIDADYAVVGYARDDFDPETDDFTFDRLPVIYHRNGNGVWQQLQTLPTIPDGGQYREPGFLAIQGNIIAYAVTGRLFVYERNASGWQESPIDPYAVLAQPHGVDIDNGTIVVGAMTCSHAEAQAYRKNASGTWVRVGTATSAPTDSCNRPSALSVATSGNTTILAVARLNDGTGAAYFFTGAPNTWSAPALTVNYPSGGGTPVAISGDLAIIAGSQVYRRSGGVWTFDEDLQREEFGTGAGAVALRGNLAALSIYRSISLFQMSTTGDASEFARLTQPGGDLAPNTLDVSGRRIIAPEGFQPLTDVPNIAEAHIFEVPTTLPTQPALIQETFQSGNAAHWTPLPGGSWSVATTAASRVYRQASLAGEATSVLSNSDWTNQAVQADVRPSAFSGNDRWFGLAVRRVDAANYYYLTVRSSGVVQLKKMVNGVFQTLASANLPISAGTDYRLRLEAIGTTLRAYVNAEELLEAIDSSLSHGQAALMMYKTAADYDNVIVSPSPQATLFSVDFNHYFPDIWTLAGQWSLAPYPDESLVQSSTAGGASAYTGNSNTDQSIYARVRETAIGTGTQPWFGLFARYRDAANYYYVTVRNSNEISLRRLVNGATQVLDSAPFNVSIDNWYELRLEAIQNQLRVYVGNRLILEATDASFSEGRFGAVMYKAAAAYDDMIVTQP